MPRKKKPCPQCKMLADMLFRVLEAEFGFGKWPTETEILEVLKIAGAREGVESAE